MNFIEETAPRPESWALFCYTSMEKSTSRDTFGTLSEVVEKYLCGYCPNGLGEQMDWICLVNSEVMDLHPGYFDYVTAREMITLHAAHVSATMKYVTEYTLPNGAVIKDFFYTDNGMLSCVEMKRPGTKLIMIPGYSKHSDLYKVYYPGEWAEKRYLSKNYASLRATMFSFALILNPMQARDLTRGRMYFDFAPGVLSTWCLPFLNCWSSFIKANPGTKNVCLYMADDKVYYGSPTDHSTAVRLYGYSGLPLLLFHYQGRLTEIMKSLISLTNQKLTDVDANVPLGKK